MYPAGGTYIIYFVKYFMQFSNIPLDTALQLTKQTLVYLHGGRKSKLSIIICFNKIPIKNSAVFLKLYSKQYPKCIILFFS